LSESLLLLVSVGVTTTTFFLFFDFVEPSSDVSDGRVGDYFLSSSSPVEDDLEGVISSEFI
jgi:hypothetical protein